MPQYKLSYFPLYGRGELIRIIFAQAGIQYEDETISLAEWPQRKAEFPLGQLPVLTVDGKLISQSNAIARFLAKEFGLAGNTNLERAQADMIVDGINDDFEKQLPFFKAKYITPALTNQTADNHKVNELEVEYKNGALKTFLELTWADIAVAGYLDRLILALEEEKFLEKFPELKQHKEKVFALPNIAAWIKKRPIYPF